MSFFSLLNIILATCKCYLNALQMLSNIIQCLNYSPNKKWCVLQCFLCNRLSKSLCIPNSCASNERKKKKKKNAGNFSFPFYAVPDIKSHNNCSYSILFKASSYLKALHLLYCLVAWIKIDSEKVDHILNEFVVQLSMFLVLIYHTLAIWCTKIHYLSL